MMVSSTFKVMVSSSFNYLYIYIYIYISCIYFIQIFLFGTFAIVSQAPAPDAWEEQLWEVLATERPVAKAKVR